MVHLSTREKGQKSLKCFLLRITTSVDGIGLLTSLVFDNGSTVTRRSMRMHDFNQIDICEQSPVSWSRKFKLGFIMYF